MLERFANWLFGAIFMWLMGLMAGCTIHHVIEFAPPPAQDASVVEWQQKITTEVNQHEQRLRELEKEKDDGTI